MKIVVVIPTYKEAENIKELIPVLSGEFEKDPQNDYQVLVVDGNSPDGTAQVVKDLSKKYPFLHLLLEEKKAGLGAAYVYGFKHAMQKMGAEVVIEMDADFQHDPHDVTRLVAPISQGFDYVIGSRFTKGGSIPKSWALYRKFLSIGGNIFSKVVLGIFNVNDFTSGFKASRVKGFLDTINLDKILSGGFAYKIDLLFKMHRVGAKIKEIPIAFGLRDRGNSKMENNNFMDSLKVVVLLRVYEHKSFFKFVIVGFTGLFVDGGLFNLLRLMPGVGSATGAIISGGFGMLTTFTLNNYWSFGDRKLSGITHKAKGAIMYFASSCVPIIVRTNFVHWADVKFNDNFWIVNLAFFCGILFGLVWNFTVYSKMIWRKKK